MYIHFMYKERSKTSFLCVAEMYPIISVIHDGITSEEVSFSGKNHN